MESTCAVLKGMYYDNCHILKGWWETEEGLVLQKFKDAPPKCIYAWRGLLNRREQRTYADRELSPWAFFKQAQHKPYQYDYWSIVNRPLPKNWAYMIRFEY